MSSVKPNPNLVLGIDVGGTGIKGGIVDLSTGELVGERVRLETPHPSTPAAIGDVLSAIARHFEWKGLIGAGFPGVVLHERIMTAANLDDSLIGLDLAHLLHERTGCRAHVINDADAAGLGEVTHGSGKGRDGVILLVTVGTGLGSALFINGTLVPNSELGHVKMKDKDTGKIRDAEKLASDTARERDELSWKAWAKRFDRYLKYLHHLFWPELIIIGGGVTKKGDKFMPLLTVPCATTLATLGNNAGIVGAATAARLHLGKG
ncbi:MAG: polyphosphate--glucose phosphotransferase [Opitutales bacterium]